MESNNRPVLQLDAEGNLIKEHPSLSKAAKEFGGTKKALQRIHYAVRGRKNINDNSDTAFGFRWKYKN